MALGFGLHEAFAENADLFTRDFCDFGDGVDGDGKFLDDAKHVGNEHEMFLADVQSAKERKA